MFVLLSVALECTLFIGGTVVRIANIIDKKAGNLI
jgi:hypothetical protein